MAEKKKKKKRSSKGMKAVAQKKSLKKPQEKAKEKAIKKIQKKQVAKVQTKKIAERKSLPKRTKAGTKKKTQKKPLKKPKKQAVKKIRTKRITRVQPAIKTKPSVKKEREIRKENEKKAALRKLLIQKREEIIRKAKEEISRYTRGDARQLVDTALDNGDWSVVDLSEDINLRQLSTHRATLQKIDEALRKLGEGTYGKCEECGEDISERRLKVLPFATLCRDCQEKKEQIEELEREEALE